jgi:hypothetical protein
MTFTSARVHQPGWLSGAFHFIILALAMQAETAAVWPYALGAMSAVSFFAWAANHRRYRQIHDLPTSKVASAAQGYVELFGRASTLPDSPVTSRLSRSPCCWYSFQIEEKSSNDKWQTVDRGRSIENFLLVDETGQCVIFPDGAEVLTNEHKQWEEGSYRYSEWLLLAKTVLYAIGDFSTSSAAAVAVREERGDVAALLAEWKKNEQQLRARFDLDQDGRIDIKEWELARLQAKREVRKQHAEAQTGSVEGVHLLRKPQDGRLFLLANEVPDKLGSRYRFWSWAHLAIFIAAGSAAIIML